MKPAQNKGLGSKSRRKGETSCLFFLLSAYRQCVSRHNAYLRISKSGSLFKFRGKATMMEEGKYKIGTKRRIGGLTYGKQSRCPRTERLKDGG